MREGGREILQKQGLESRFSVCHHENIHDSIENGREREGEDMSENEI